MNKSNRWILISIFSVFIILSIASFSLVGLINNTFAGKVKYDCQDYDIYKQNTHTTVSFVYVDGQEVAMENYNESVEIYSEKDKISIYKLSKCRQINDIKYRNGNVFCFIDTSSITPNTFRSTCKQN